MTAVAALTVFCQATPAFAENWLVLSGLSYHFRQNERNWRQSNPGIGAERKSERFNDVYWMGGYFRNSYDRHTAYAGARWMPYHVGPFAFGAYAMAATGYPSPVIGGPGFSIESRRMAINFVVVPNLPNHSGFIATQLRFKIN